MNLIFKGYDVKKDEEEIEIASYWLMLHIGRPIKFLSKSNTFKIYFYLLLDAM